MSKIARIKALAPTTTARPWKFGPQRPSGSRMIADVVSVPDCELLTEAVNTTDALLALYGVASRMRERLASGKTTMLAADKKAMLAALTELES